MRTLPEPDGFAGRFLLGPLIGTGGVGCVYAATELASGRRVTVKFLRPELKNDPGRIACLLEESRIAGLVRSPHVVRILGDGICEEHGAFIVMEHLPGTPLGALVRANGPFSLARTRTIAGQILSGLQAVHAAGYLHGDMKSDNILLDVGRRDRATIIDFGLARPPADEPYFIDDDVVSGTPDYTAPEVVLGKAATVAADVYSVGVVLYELVTGTTPFGGGGATAVFARHITDDVVPPSLRYPDGDIPPAFEKTLLTALAKDPAARHASASSLAAAVVASLRSVPREPQPVVRAAFSVDRPTLDWLRPFELR